MNILFSEYSTSTAFCIQLSKNQCNALLRCEGWEQIPGTAAADKYFESPHRFTSVGTLQPLEARGLVFWHRDARGKANGFGGLTEAGKLMVGLLKQAGMTIENTNTPSVLRRMGGEAA